MRSDGFKNSKNSQGFSKIPENQQNRYYQKQSTKGQNSINCRQSQQRNKTIKQVNKYEVTTKFTGDNTKLFTKNWKKLKSDKHVLDIVTNELRLDFKEFPKNRQYQFRKLKNDELNIVETEADKLLRKQVICESKREANEYLSNVFTKNKKDGAKRTILNLKQFITPMTYHHFKMESFNQVIGIDRPNVYRHQQI